MHSPAPSPAPPPARRLPPLGEPWHAWLALLIGVLAISAHSASSVTYSVLMKPILAEFGWQRTEFASAMTLRMLVMVAVSPLAGLLTDRVGARAVLVGGALIIGAGNLALSRVGSLGELFAFMACMGPGQAGIGAVAASALVLRLFKRRRGIAIGILNGGDNLISSTIPIAAVASLERWGWRSTLVALALTYFVLGALIRAALGDRTESAAPDAESTARADGSLRDLPWRDPRLWILFLAYAGIYAFITSVQLHLHAFQTDLGRTPEEASQVLSTLILVGAVGAPLFGWLAERASPESALAIVVAGLTVTSVALWTIDSFAAFIAWAVVYGLVNSGVVALLALVLTDLFGAPRIGRLMGVAMVFCMGSTMLANVYAASMFDRFGSYLPVWRSYTVLMAATMLPVALLWRRAVLERGRARAVS